MTDLAIIKGWVHSIRDHKKILFLQLWDGKKALQCVVTGDTLAENKASITTMACLELTGEIVENKKSPTRGQEMQVKSIRLLGAGSDDFRSELNKESDIHILMKKRHLLHWTDMVSPDTRECMYMRDQLNHKISEFFKTLEFLKVEPPTIVDIETEGGSTLFKVDYYGQVSYLTQSSQLYLESVLPGYGNVWCLESSYRAEKSSTPRHLAEYKHLEAEMSFITFDELLDHIEQLVVTLCQSQVSPEQCAKYGYDKPFLRMKHSDAVDQLREMKVTRPGTDDLYTYGDDLPDSAEMKLLEKYQCPIFLTHFPAAIKSFYMKKCGHGLTESADLLLPGVGEVVGGSMRMEDHGELVQAFKDNGIDTKPYYWYLDTRKYGTCPHGGYGLGVERLVKAIRYAMDKPIDHVRTACLYPVYYH